MSRDLATRIFDAFVEHHVPDAMKTPEARDVLRQAFDVGRTQGRPHKRNGRRPQFTMPEVVSICAAYYDKSRNLSVSDIARMYKCSPGVITRIIEGKYIPRIDP